MANYIALNSEFQPYSLADYLLPLQEYGREYSRQEEALDALAVMSDQWKNKINQDSESKSWNLYDRYSSDLAQYVSDLNTKGLSVSTRRNLNDIKRRYSSEIKPIEDAYQSREADVKRQNDIYDKSGGMARFSRDARTTPLDYYLNPDREDFKSIDLNQVTQMGMNDAKTIFSKYIQTSEGKRFAGDYHELVTRRGLDKDQVLDIMEGRIEMYPELGKALENAQSKIGIENFKDHENEILDSWWQGVNWGIPFDENRQLYQNIDRGTGGGGGDSAPENRLFTFKGKAQPWFRSSTDRDIYEKAVELVGITEEMLANSDESYAQGISRYEETLNNAVREGRMTPAQKEIELEKYKEENTNYMSNNYYSDVDELLLNAGYTAEELSTMSKEEKRRKVEGIAAFDVTGRMLYEYSLDSGSTKNLKNRLTNLKAGVTEIEGIKDGKYIPGKDLAIDVVLGDDEAATIAIDPIKGELLLIKQGRRYKLPKDIFDANMRNMIDEKRIRESYEIIKETEEKENLTETEYEDYQNAQRYISLVNEILEETVLDIGNQVGTHKFKR